MKVISYISSIKILILVSFKNSKLEKKMIFFSLLSNMTQFDFIKRICPRFYNYINSINFEFRKMKNIDVYEYQQVYKNYKIILTVKLKEKKFTLKYVSINFCCILKFCNYWNLYLKPIEKKCFIEFFDKKIEEIFYLCSSTIHLCDKYDYSLIEINNLSNFSISIGCNEKFKFINSTKIIFRQNKNTSHQRKNNYNINCEILEIYNLSQYELSFDYSKVFFNKINVFNSEIPDLRILTIQTPEFESENFLLEFIEKLTNLKMLYIKTFYYLKKNYLYFEKFTDLDLIVHEYYFGNEDFDFDDNDFSNDFGYEDFGIRPHYKINYEFYSDESFKNYKHDIPSKYPNQKLIKNANY